MDFDHDAALLKGTPLQANISLFKNGIPVFVSVNKNLFANDGLVIFPLPFPGQPDTTA